MLSTATNGILINSTDLTVTSSRSLSPDLLSPMSVKPVSSVPVCPIGGFHDFAAPRYPAPILSTDEDEKTANVKTTTVILKNDDNSNILNSDEKVQQEAPIESALNEDSGDSKEETVSFIADENVLESIAEIFQYVKQLGAGASGRVLKVRHKADRGYYALKEMKKNQAENLQSLTNEYQILRMLKLHPNIVSLQDAYCDKLCYYIATGYCSGGTMLKKILKLKSFSEKKAAGYIQSILSAVQYMHNLNIVHCDLKCNNIVFDKPGKHAVLKIIDFGESMIVDPQQTYKECAGTIHYVPPEVTESRSGNDLKAGDCWSIGVISYILVVGKVPFPGENQTEILRNIQSKDKQITFPKLTSSCKEFIRGLLTDDISSRMTAAGALEHKWISGDGASNQDLSNGSFYIESLKKYEYQNHLQQILVHALLTEIDAEDQKALHQELLHLNKNRSGFDEKDIMDHLLVHADIAALPGHTRQCSTVELQDWKEKKWTELCSIQTQPPVMDMLSPQLRSIDLFAAQMAMNGHHDNKRITEVTLSGKGTDSPTSPLELANASSTPSISVERFRAIIAQASGHWDVEPVIKMLASEDNMISIESIALYQRGIEKLPSLNDDEQDFLECIKFALQVVETMKDEENVEDKQ